MGVVDRPVGAVVHERGGSDPTPGGAPLDWAVATLSLFFVGGLYLDGWAHAHGRVDQSFFTPWHAVFYAGYAMTSAVLAVAALKRRAQGYAWRRVAPPGYGLSLVGVLVFALAGAGDMVWHILFGVEAGVQALLSPTHLGLALGMGFIASGPLRAAWRRAAPALGWAAQAPMVLALTSTLSIFTLFTLYAHPIVQPAAGAGHPYAGSEAMGVASIVVQTGLLMGTILLAMRFGTLPPGTLTVMVALNAAGMGFLNIHGDYPLALVVGAGMAGLLADLLRSLLRPAAGRPLAWRLFAFAVPTVFYLCYFLTLMLSEGLAWSVHVWTGAVVLAGIAGWLLSHLLLPPRSLEPG